MTGLVYKHMPMGALPLGYEEIRDLNSVDKVYMEICDTISVQFVPKVTDEINESLFTLDELDVLNDVCHKFENVSGSDLSVIMHQEDIYKMTEEKDILDFSMIASLKAFDE